MLGLMAVLLRGGKAMQPETYPSAMDPEFSEEQILSHISSFVRAVAASDQMPFRIQPGEDHREAIASPLGEWLDALPWWLKACETTQSNDPAIACFIEACRMIGLLFREGQRYRRVTVDVTPLKHARNANSLVNALRHVLGRMSV